MDREALLKCRLCARLATRKRVVPGTGDLKSKYMFIGIAPSIYGGDLTGTPFTGRSSYVLEKALEAMNLTREQVYITNMLKCSLPENGNPIPEEINNCKPILMQEIEESNAEHIFLLGKIVSQSILGKDSVTLTSNGERKVLFLRDGRHVSYYACWHPSFVARRPDLMEKYIGFFKGVAHANHNSA